MEYYTPVKNNKIVLYVLTWKMFEISFLKGKEQVEEKIYIIVIYVGILSIYPHIYGG